MVLQRYCKLYQNKCQKHNIMTKQDLETQRNDYFISEYIRLRTQLVGHGVAIHAISNETDFSYPVIVEVVKGLRKQYDRTRPMKRVTPHKK